MIEEDQEADIAKMKLLAEQFSNVVVSTDLHSDWKAWRSSLLHGLSKDAVEKLTSHDMSKLVQNDGLSSLDPALSLVAAIGLVIPATTVDRERRFSAVGRIKTKLRTRLTESSLENLLFIVCEGPGIGNFNFDEAVICWVYDSRRRVNVL